MKDVKKIIFLGNPVSERDAVMGRIHDVNIADNIAQNTVIKGLHERYGEDLTVVSVSADKKATPDIDLDGIKSQTIASNNRNAITYYLSTMMNYTKRLYALMKYFHGRDVLIITNGPYIYRALAVLVAKWRYRNVKWVPFLVGAVEVPEVKFPFSLISKLSRWTIRRADGAITYVAKSVLDYMPGKPFVEIVYLIDDTLLQIYRDYCSKKNDTFTITYTGALTSIYNIGVIIEVIRQTGTMYHWVFAGGGQYEEEIETMSKDDRYNVDYLGKVSNIEAAKLQKASHLLLCLKGGNYSAINQYYSKYAASGKLTEYLCSGVPILAGDIPAFSEKIRPFATFEKEQTVDRIIDKLADIKESYADKVMLAERGQEYAFKYFSAEYQNKKIYDFLENL